jgi:hypothetical protein
VFSDEFSKDGRRFEAGADPYWTAVRFSSLFAPLSAHFSLCFPLAFRSTFRSTFRSLFRSLFVQVDHFNPTTSDLEIYKPEMVTTQGGNMVISATVSHPHYPHLILLLSS